MAKLAENWTTLYKSTLPNLARSKSAAQRRWSVQLDHCFARIILDAVVGRGEVFEPNSSTVVKIDDRKPAPWTDALKAPAVRNMTESDLKRCIALGEAIANGSVDLVNLDDESLRVRGKDSKSNEAKRKRSNLDETESQPLSDILLKMPPSPKALHRNQKDIRAAFGVSLDAPTANPARPALVEPELFRLIETSQLTDFRKKVLLAVCQIPQGEVSSYLALSKFLNSGPRAVGNALRNNPFAPRVPCHRIVAADKTIGGFGGSWGIHGEHFNKKVDLLTKEGVKINAKDGRLGNAIWEGFL